MELQNLDYLFNHTINIKKTRKDEIVKLLDSMALQHEQFIPQEDFKLIVHDIWTMLEIGDQFKNEVATSEITFKDFRLFILEFIMKNSLLNSTNSANFYTEKRFFIALLIGKMLTIDYRKQFEVLWDIQGDMQKDVQNQQKFVEIQRNSFQHLYKYEKVFQEIICQVLTQIHAVEEILSPDVWVTIKEDHFELLLKSIEMNHFDEIVFWKNKFENHSSIDLQKEPNYSYIFCIQQDASMCHYLNLQTALVSTIYEAMEKNQQSSIFIPFAEDIEKETVVLDGNLHVDQFFQINQFQENNGHVNYKNALNYALLMSKLELTKHEACRIYFLCNEEIYRQMPADLQWEEAVRHFKEINNVHITVIYLGDLTEFQDIWFADHTFSPEQILAEV